MGSGVGSAAVQRFCLDGCRRPSYSMQLRPACHRGRPFVKVCTWLVPLQGCGGPAAAHLSGRPARHRQLYDAQRSGVRWVWSHAAHAVPAVLMNARLSRQVCQLVAEGLQLGAGQPNQEQQRHPLPATLALPLARTLSLQTPFR